LKFLAEAFAATAQVHDAVMLRQQQTHPANQYLNTIETDWLRQNRGNYVLVGDIPGRRKVSSS